MVQSVLSEISKLRLGAPITIDYHNSNRYRLVAQENNGSKTAYCFSTPIYNTNSRKLVRRRFEANGEAFKFTGSNADITAYKGQIVMSNTEGSASIRLPIESMTLCEDHLCSEDWQIYPTFNGIAVHTTKPSVKFTVSIDKPFLGIRHCSKSFAIMQEEFRPFFTLSPLTSSDRYGRTSPTEVHFEQIDERTYKLGICAVEGSGISFEANLYEPKLLQDTTVESAHPDENNAFGGIAFLGKTSALGEQWLYSRLDFSKIPELHSVYVKKVQLHLPVIYSTGNELSAFAPKARFCSFGSTWNNKIAELPKTAKIYKNGAYMTVDLTEVLTNTSEGRLIHTEGLILKPKGRDSGFTAISTGDNYGLPQILEVRYNI